MFINIFFRIKKLQFSKYFYITIFRNICKVKSFPIFRQFSYFDKKPVTSFHFIPLFFKKRASFSEVLSQNIFKGNLYNIYLVSIRIGTTLAFKKRFCNIYLTNFILSSNSCCNFCNILLYISSFLLTIFYPYHMSFL